jgi:hypothetical protein
MNLYKYKKETFSLDSTKGKIKCDSMAEQKVTKHTKQWQKPTSCAGWDAG